MKNARSMLAEIAAVEESEDTASDIARAELQERAAAERKGKSGDARVFAVFNGYDLGMNYQRHHPA